MFLAAGRRQNCRQRTKAQSLKLVVSNLPRETLRERASGRERVRESELSRGMGLLAWELMLVMSIACSKSVCNIFKPLPFLSTRIPDKRHTHTQAHRPYCLPDCP